MKQVVLFHCEVKIGDFIFKTDQMYVLEIKGNLPTKLMYYRGICLIHLNRFQNDYVDRHCVEWIDDPEVLAALAA